MSGCMMALFLPLTPMRLILLQPIRGIGGEFDLVEVNDARALTEILPKQQALIATPSVLKRLGGLGRDLTQESHAS